MEMKDPAVPAQSGLHASISHLAHVRSKDYPAYRNRGTADETLTPPERDHLYDDPLCMEVSLRPLFYNAIAIYGRW